MIKLSLKRKIKNKLGLMSFFFNLFIKFYYYYHHHQVSFEKLWYLTIYIYIYIYIYKTKEFDVCMT